MQRDKCKVQVWNDQDFTWKETFKDKVLEIPSKSFIEMEFYDAHQFKGQFCPLLDDGNGGIAQISEKRIRCVEKQYADVVRAGEETEAEVGYKCNLCKEDFTTPKELIAHSEKKHADRIVQDEEAEVIAPKKRMGRPPKVKTETVTT